MSKHLILSHWLWPFNPQNPLYPNDRCNTAFTHWKENLHIRLEITESEWLSKILNFVVLKILNFVVLKILNFVVLKIMNFVVLTVMRFLKLSGVGVGGYVLSNYNWQKIEYLQGNYCMQSLHWGIVWLKPHYCICMLTKAASNNNYCIDFHMNK